VGRTEGESMKQPPKIARNLLLSLGGDSAKYAAGDLDAEFHERQSRGWYWRQAMRSIPPLMLLELSQGEWRFSMLGLLIAATLPLLLFDACWSFVLSQIPLKDGLVRGTDFVLLSIGIQAVSGWFAGAVLRSDRLKLASLMVSLTVLTAVNLMRGVTPDGFAIASCFAATAGLNPGAYTRRRLI
jgi:hypothetical protein